MLKSGKEEGWTSHGSQWDGYLFLISKLRPELRAVRLRSVQRFSEQNESGQSPRWGGKNVPPPPEPGRSLCVTSHPAILSIGTLSSPWWSQPSNSDSRKPYDQRRAKTKFTGCRSGRRTFLLDQWSQINGTFPQEPWEWTIYITHVTKNLIVSDSEIELCCFLMVMSLFWGRNQGEPNISISIYVVCF